MIVYTCRKIVLGGAGDGFTEHLVAGEHHATQQEHQRGQPDNTGQGFPNQQFNLAVYGKCCNNMIV